MESAPYEVRLSLVAASSLAALDPERRREIERRLRAIAELAAEGPRVSHPAPPAVLTAKGLTVRYVVSDEHRTLTVLEMSAPGGA